MFNSPSSAKKGAPSDKCFDCILWEEKQRIWQRERAQLLKQIECLRVENQGASPSANQNIQLDDDSYHHASAAPSTARPESEAAFSKDYQQVGSPIHTSQARGHHPSSAQHHREMHAYLKQEEPQGQYTRMDRAVQCHIPSQAEKQREESIERRRHQVSAADVLIKKQSDEILSLQADVAKLQIALKGQQNDLRDYINSNQRKFLAEHQLHIEEESRTRAMQKSLLGQHPDSPSSRGDNASGKSSRPAVQSPSSTNKSPSASRPVTSGSPSHHANAGSEERLAINNPSALLAQLRARMYQKDQARF